MLEKEVEHQKKLRRIQGQNMAKHLGPELDKYFMDRYEAGAGEFKIP